MREPNTPIMRDCDLAVTCGGSGDGALAPTYENISLLPIGMDISCGGRGGALALACAVTSVLPIGLATASGGACDVISVLPIGMATASGDACVMTSVLPIGMATMVTAGGLASLCGRAGARAPSLSVSLVRTGIIFG